MAALEATTSFSLLPIDFPKMQLLITGLCLAGALLVGAIVLALVGRWWKKHAPQEDQSPSAQLAHFRSLYEKGAISQEEFEQLRSLLAGRLRETMGMSAPAPHGPTKTPGEKGRPPDNPETDVRPAD